MDNRMKVYKICSCFLCLCLLIDLRFVAGITVSTLNIWNLMFNWNVRKHRIAEMIRSTNTDVIALQEVRSGMSENQLLELKSLLPRQYKWYSFRSANNVSLPDRAIHTQLYAEGIGLISRFPIKQETFSYLVPGLQDPDTNKRLIVHAEVEDRAGNCYNIIVVHLSYHRQQQCKNMAEIITFIKRKRLKNLIILGDFNTYNDYEWPVQMLTLGTKDKGHGNRCYRLAHEFDLDLLEEMKDAWSSVHGDEPGLTFSNMPHPGLESRPDRIVLSSSLNIRFVSLLGDGSTYKQHYTSSVHWDRVWTILAAAKLSFEDVKGYPCLQDCGPSGSCLCGICVKVGDAQNCDLPDCSICTAETYQTSMRYLIIAVIVIFHFCYAVILIIIIAAGSYGETVYSILGFQCCLFNPDLCNKSVRNFQRKHKFLRLLNLWPVFRLPPYVQLLLSFVVFVGFCFYVRDQLDAIFQLAYTTLDEEFFPSDHLMLTAEIE